MQHKNAFRRMSLRILPLLVAVSNTYSWYHVFFIAGMKNDLGIPSRCLINQSFQWSCKVSARNKQFKGRKSLPARYRYLSITDEFHFHSDDHVTQTSETSNRVNSLQSMGVKYTRWHQLDTVLNLALAHSTNN